MKLAKWCRSMLRGCRTWDRRFRHHQMRGVRTYRGDPAERADTRAWSETHRKSSRPGATVPVWALLCQGPGRGVDQVEGDELNRFGKVAPSSANFNHL